MINLEIELNKFKKTAEENPNLTQDIRIGFENELVHLINRFLEEAKDGYVKDEVCELVFGLTLDSPRCYRTEPNFRIYDSEQFRTRLNKVNLFTAPILLGSMLKKIGFKKGFSKEAKKFVTEVYDIIYKTYIKETAEKENAKRNSLGSDYLL